MENTSCLELMKKSGVAFGTSGARGLVVDFSEELLCGLAISFAQYIAKGWAFDSVVIAGDLRPSTPHFVKVLGYTLEQKGYKVIYGGEIPSPAVALYGLVHKIPSIMVTGSHIPDDRNGIKFNTPDGEITKADEQGILAEIPEGLSKFVNEQGELLHKEILENEIEVDESVAKAYVDRYVEWLPKGVFKGSTVGFYQHSAVGREIIPQIFKELGAEVIELGYSEVFVPVDTEAIRPEDQELALNWAKEKDFDLLFSTDGDSDRPIVADEKGQWLRGDVLGVLTAECFNIEAIATPVSCNSLVERAQYFAQVNRTRIGSPFVLAAMAELAEEFDSVAGYEANGGFLTQTEIEFNKKGLAALPTRDAVLPMIAALLRVQKEKAPMSQLLSELLPIYTASDRIKETPTEKSKQLIQALIDQDPKGQLQMSELEKLAGGTFAKSDLTDGMRIYFSNNAVIHLRPSGNAPELRCYSEANQEDVAQQLVNDTLTLIKKRLS